MRRTGADCLVVVMKALYWSWSDGGGSAPLTLGQPVLPGGTLLFSGRRQPSRDGMSRMMREYHVRICEGLRVKFPGPTRQKSPYAMRREVSPSGNNGLAGLVSKWSVVPLITDRQPGDREPIPFWPMGRTIFVVRDA